MPSEQENRLDLEGVRRFIEILREPNQRRARLLFKEHYSPEIVQKMLHDKVAEEKTLAADQQLRSLVAERECASLLARLKQI